MKYQKTVSITNYHIVLERNPINGSVSVSAIPDNGDTIRRTFYGYTTKEMRREIAAMVRLGF